MHRSGLIALVCALAVLAAACGGSNDSADSDERSRASDSTAPDTTVDTDEDPTDSTAADTPADTTEPPTVSLDLSVFENAAVAAADALDDPDDPREPENTEVLEECLAESAADRTDGIELLDEIGATVSPDGLTEPAARLVAECFSGAITAEVFAAGLPDTVTVSDDETECALEVYRTADLDDLVERLMVDIDDNDLAADDASRLINCLDDSTLVAIFDDLTGLEIDGSEARCFYDEVAGNDDVEVEALNCLPVEAVRSFYGATLASLDLTDDEVRCASEGFILESRDEADAAGEEFARCGIFGRTLAASVQSRGIALSQDSIDCVDREVALIDPEVSGALSDALRLCLTADEFTAVTGETTTEVPDAAGLVDDAVAALDGDDTDPIAPITVELVTECLASQAAEPGVAELLQEIGETAPGEGLSADAAALAASCFRAAVTTDSVPEIFGGFDLDDVEAQCVVDGYLAGDPQITIDNLQSDVTNSDPGGEVNRAAIDCVDDDDLVGGLAAQGLDVTPDEARCFFAAGLSGESDAEIFEAYATCGVAGRLYAESLDDVVLSDDSVACLDRVLPGFTFFDADDALAECLTADELAAVGAG